jgi:hypothetical protein
VRWVYTIGVIQAVTSILTLFINLFSCTPIRYNWDFGIDGWCLDQAAIFAATESVNSAVDLVMVALACFMVHKLRLKLSAKIKLGFILALGSLCVVLLNQSQHNCGRNSININAGPASLATLG